MTGTSGSVSLSLAGRRALVTGGARGIGAAIARELGRHGAHVVINFNRDEAGTRATAHAIEEAGGTAGIAQANLLDPSAIRAMFEVLADGGGLDILVHNAAIGSFKDTLDVRANQWDITLSTNARALLLCAQAAAPLMEAHGGGRIVSVSSTGSRSVIPAYGAIGVSKAALESLTRYLAVELAPRGVLVNAVSAGPVDTATLRRHPTYEALADRARRGPAGRMGQPDDVARVVLFLCSPLADWIIGQTIVADGGLSLTS